MNRGRNTWLLGAVALIAIGLLAAPPAAAQPGQDREVVTMAAGPGAVTWAPRISYEEMTLTVAGGGYAFTQVFARGESPSFAPVDAEGHTLPDGTYNWEIRVSPDRLRLDTSAFSNGKVSADGRTMEAPRAPRGEVQSGAFTIKNGAIVDSTLVETATKSAPDRGGLRSAAADVDDSDAAAPRN